MRNLNLLHVVTAVASNCAKEKVVGHVVHPRSSGVDMKLQ